MNKRVRSRRIWHRAALLLALICSLAAPRGVLAVVISTVDDEGLLTVTGEGSAASSSPALGSISSSPETPT